MKNFNRGPESYTPNQEFQYHYSREERLGRKISHLGNEIETSESRKRLKKKMPILITFLDISLVLSIFLIYKFFLLDNINKTDYQGIEFESQSLIFENYILMSVDAFGQKESDIFEKEITVTFEIFFKDDIIDSFQIKDSLPNGPSDVKTFSKKYIPPFDINKNDKKNKELIQIKSSIKIEEKVLEFKKKL